MISAICVYQTNQLPDLKQIRSTEESEENTLDLTFDEVNQALI